MTLFYVSTVDVIDIDRYFEQFVSHILTTRLNRKGNPRAITSPYLETVQVGMEMSYT